MPLMHKTMWTRPSLRFGTRLVFVSATSRQYQANDVIHFSNELFLTIVFEHVNLLLWSTSGLLTINTPMTGAMTAFAKCCQWCGSEHCKNSWCWREAGCRWTVYYCIKGGVAMLLNKCAIILLIKDWWQGQDQFSLPTRRLHLRKPSSRPDDALSLLLPSASTTWI